MRRAGGAWTVHSVFGSAHNRRSSPSGFVDPWRQWEGWASAPWEKGHQRPRRHRTQIPDHAGPNRPPRAQRRCGATPCGGADQRRRVRDGARRRRLRRRAADRARRPRAVGVRSLRRGLPHRFPATPGHRRKPAPGHARRAHRRPTAGRSRRSERAMRAWDGMRAAPGQSRRSPTATTMTVTTTKIAERTCDAKPRKAPQRDRQTGQGGRGAARAPRRAAAEANTTQPAPASGRRPGRRPLRRRRWPCWAALARFSGRKPRWRLPGWRCWRWPCDRTAWKAERIRRDRRPQPPARTARQFRRIAAGRSRAVPPPPAAPARPSR